jgi:hypothetical protein
MGDMHNTMLMLQRLTVPQQTAEQICQQTAQEADLNKQLKKQI